MTKEPASIPAAQRKTKPLHVVQVLPELQSGGVERGTVEFSRYIAERGHRSTVISNGGRLVRQLEAEGGHHVSLPVHRKSLASLKQVGALRGALLALHPDIVHVRSRMPAWLVYLALRKVSPIERPVVVSTFHGLYSVNRYSAIMKQADSVIAISRCVRDYIVENYAMDAEQIRVIPRGVDIARFDASGRPSAEWLGKLHADYPAAKGKMLLLMPGRLTRWKGQLDFITLMARLKHEAPDRYFGVVVGEADAGKQKYLEELKTETNTLGVQSDLAFVGHRSDMVDWYAASSAVFNLSQQPEPFGRTVIEALASGTPVLAYRLGGPAEVLEDIFPDGLVDSGDLGQLVRQTRQICEGEASFSASLFGPPYTLEAQSSTTLDVYRMALLARSLS